MPSFNPGPLEAEAGGSLKFKASLVYRASSRAMQKTNKQTTKEKKNIKKERERQTTRAELQETLF